MIAKNDLHQLIHSLTKSEKRYFNLFAKRHVIGKENKYIRLFAAIEKQKVYDEVGIKQQLNDAKTNSNLASEKVYLKELILKSLKQFHEKNFTDSILYDRLIQIEILYEKGLFQMGYELINKSILMSEKYQKFLIQATLLLWKVNYDIKLNKFDLVSLDIEIIDSNVDNFKEYIGYMNGSFGLLSVYKKLGGANDTAVIKNAISLSQKYLKNKEPKSVLAAYYFYSIHAFIGDLKNDKLMTLKNFEKSLAVFKKNRFFIEERPNLFFISANNYIVSLIENDELTKAENELFLLKNIVSKLDLTGQLRARAFLIISDNMLNVLKKQNNWGFASEISKDIENGLVEFEKFIDPGRKIDLYFSLASVHFNAKEYRLSNRFLNKIIKAKSDYHVVEDAMILQVLFAQLLIMMDSNELYLFKNKVQSAKRFMEKKAPSEWRASFVDFLNIAANSKNKKDDKIKVKERALLLIEEANKDVNLKRLNSYFDLLAWLKRKYCSQL
jgi:hypothetical protein